jgi:phosphoglycerol transferase MdoB-like AlkP superfamily enzyme
MGFQAFARCCGFEAYYGKDEYDNKADYDGYWAIWDEEFLQYYARTMGTMHEPFMTALFTATSHHPFRVPKRYEGVFPEGTSPLHRCIGYTDNALRKFFDCAKTQKWYKNTLFVITADHTNELMHREYLNDKGAYEVPIIFFSPMWNVGYVDSTTAVSQADIMPSVLGVLKYEQPYVAFGEDVLTQTYEHKYVVNYNEPIYQCFSDSMLLQFDGKEPTHLYCYTHDRLLQHDLLPEQRDDEKVQQMLRYMKAYVQQYYTRMITNRLTTE